MYRTLTAGVALAAALGTAGLALAQSTVPNATQSPTMATPQPAPSASTAPSGSYQQPAAGQQSLQDQQGQQLNSPANIQQAQQRLQAQGLYNGPIDGRSGPEMKTALMQFQQRNGLPQTGVLDQQTQARLMQSSSNGLGPTPTSGSAMRGTGATKAPMTPPATNR